MCFFHSAVYLVDQDISIFVIYVILEVGVPVVIRGVHVLQATILLEAIKAFSGALGLLSVVHLRATGIKATKAYLDFRDLFCRELLLIRLVLLG